MKKKIIPVIIAIVLIIVVGAIGIGTLIYEKYSYSMDRADLNEYFEIYNTTEVPIILQTERVAERAKIIEDNYYLDFATVQKYFNARFYVDETEGYVLYTTPTDIVKTTIGEMSYIADGTTIEENYIIARYEGDILYVAIDYIKKYTNFSYECFSEPNRMQVYKEWGIQTIAKVEKDSWIRVKGGVKSDILKDVKEGDRLIVLEELENWSKVQSADGMIGYIENKRLTNIKEEQQEAVTDYVEPIYTSIKKDYTINMAWHQVFGASANGTRYDYLPKTK